LSRPLAAPAAGRVETPLEVAAAPLASEPDPARLLELFPSETRFVLTRPAERFALAAVGEVRAIVERGAGALERSVDRLERAGSLPAGLFWAGGFAFDPSVPAAGEMPGAFWTAPALALWREGGRAGLLAAARVGETRSGLRARLERVRAALERPRRPRGEEGAAASQGIVSQPVATWRRAVEATLADLAAGRFEKLVLARACELRSAAPFEPARALRRLAAQQPGATLFALGRGDATLVGATPELLVRVRGREIETAALAGTAPAGAVPRRLIADAKERREHALVLHHLEAGLRPLCERLEAAGSPEVAAAGPCRHLRTPVRGRLRSGVGVAQVAARLHPTPAVAGLPVAEARLAIAEREPVPRGWYAGGIGWIGAEGGEVAVALRCALIRRERALLHAGAGIVVGSEWERELEETRLKMQPMLGALLEV